MSVLERTLPFPFRLGDKDPNMGGSGRGEKSGAERDGGTFRRVGDKEGTGPAGSSMSPPPRVSRCSVGSGRRPGVTPPMPGTWRDGRLRLVSIPDGITEACPRRLGLRSGDGNALARANAGSLLLAQGMGVICVLQRRQVRAGSTTHACSPGVRWLRAAGGLSSGRPDRFLPPRAGKPTPCSEKRSTLSGSPPCFKPRGVGGLVSRPGGGAAEEQQKTEEDSSRGAGTRGVGSRPGGASLRPCRRPRATGARSHREQGSVRPARHPHAGPAPVPAAPIGCAGYPEATNPGPRCGCGGTAVASALGHPC